MESSTENFNTYEALVYEYNTEKSSENRKSYQYWLKYRNKPFEIDDYIHDGAKIRSIKAISSPCDRLANKISITEEAWIDGKKTVNTSCTVNGTVEEMAEKQDLGINAVNHFRLIANNVFPFEEDIIEKLCSGLIGKRDDLAIFIPEFGLEEKTAKLQYKKNSK